MEHRKEKPEKLIQELSRKAIKTLDRYDNPIDGDTYPQDMAEHGLDREHVEMLLWLSGLPVEESFVPFEERKKKYCNLQYITSSSTGDRGTEKKTDNPDFAAVASEVGRRNREVKSARAEGDLEQITNRFCSSSYRTDTSSGLRILNGKKTNIVLLAKSHCTTSAGALFVSDAA